MYRSKVVDGVLNLLSVPQCGTVHICDTALRVINVLPKTVPVGLATSLKCVDKTRPRNDPCVRFHVVNVLPPACHELNHKICLTKRPIRFSFWSDETLANRG